MSIDDPGEALILWSAILDSSSMEGSNGEVACETAEEVISKVAARKLDLEQKLVRQTYELALRQLFWDRVHANLLDNKTIDMGSRFLQIKGLQLIEKNPSRRHCSVLVREEWRQAASPIASFRDSRPPQ